MSMDPASVSNKLFARIFLQAKSDPETTFPDVFEIGEELGYPRDLVLAAMEQLVAADLVRWKTTHWVELTPLGLVHGQELEPP